MFVHEFINFKKFPNEIGVVKGIGLRGEEAPTKQTIHKSEG